MEEVSLPVLLALSSLKSRTSRQAQVTILMAGTTYNRTHFANRCQRRMLIIDFQDSELRNPWSRGR